MVQGSDVTISNGVTCTGDVHLILTDGSKLAITSPSGTTALSPGDGNTLQIYGQTKGTGQLNATAYSGGSGSAAIGGQAKAIIINGGTITATGSYQGAGIGSDNAHTIESITINDGTITAKGGSQGAAIGGNATAITINNGTITATGGKQGAAIGSSYARTVGSITINCGIIKATGGEWEDYQMNTHHCQAIGAGSNGTCNSVVINPHIAVYAGSNSNSTSLFSNDGTNIAGSLTQYYALITDDIALKVAYIDADGKAQTCATATAIKSYEGNLSLAAGWYAVAGKDMKVTNGITCKGDVHIILVDDAKLTVTGSNHVNGISVGSGNTLQIYGQTGNTGELVVSTGNYGAGIGGVGKAVIINGGIIQTTGGYCSPGIGSSPKSGGTNVLEEITINGGNITSSGGYMGAGIGAGSEYHVITGGVYGGQVNTLTINGGNIRAYGKEQSAGIGCGCKGYVNLLTINGGDIVATGSSAGIGAGDAGMFAGEPSWCNNIVINGGEIYAFGSGSGIGHGDNPSTNNSLSTCDNITVNKDLYIYTSAYSSFSDVTGAFENDGSNLVATLTKDYTIIRSTPAPDYLRFIGQEDGQIAFNKWGTVTAVLQYTSNPYTQTPEWTDYTYDTQLSLGKNEALYFRAKEQSGVTPTFSIDENNNIQFSATAKVAAGGNVMSLLNFGPMARFAFGYLFMGCEKLTAAPKLPETTLADYCYIDMFHGCKGLTEAPELPATIMKEGCYASMFGNCDGLTETPDIKATTLANSCFLDMFAKCEKLSKVTVHFTDWLSDDEYATFSWMYNVASTGVFICPEGLDITTEGVNRVPAGWLVVKDGKYSRSLTNKWGTVCLPFDVEADDNEGFDLYELSDVNNDVLTLKKITGTLTAGTPAIIRMSEVSKNAETEKYELSLPVGIVSFTTINTPEAVGGLTLTGAYTTTEITDVDGYIIANNAFWNISDVKGSNKVYCSPFRAYLAGTIASGARCLTIGVGKTTDLTPTLSLREGALNGKFIVNGRLVIIKDGKEYGIGGQEVK